MTMKPSEKADSLLRKSPSRVDALVIASEVIDVLKKHQHCTSCVIELAYWKQVRTELS